jgi:hypothetical protein
MVDVSVEADSPGKILAVQDVLLDLQVIQHRYRIKVFAAARIQVNNMAKQIIRINFLQNLDGRSDHEI